LAEAVRLAAFAASPLLIAATAAAQGYPPAQLQNGQRVFVAQCGFCHGRDAAGGETGPDLTRSPLVAQDVAGDKIGPVVKTGRTDKGMPAFRLDDAELAAVVAFIHDQKVKAAAPGGRRGVDPADLQTGNADAGQRYFSGAGGCSACHSPTGDLAGIAGRLQPLALLERMLYPRGRNARATVTVTVAGQTVSGALAYRDEFTIALTDADGRYRSWPTSQVTFTVKNPLDAHYEQLGKYTDDDMHNVLAFLRTLR
jgi:cytochrome c oxidase cbb3-type subunit 3